jgi:hypothetical protein
VGARPARALVLEAPVAADLRARGFLPAMEKAGGAGGCRPRGERGGTGACQHQGKRGGAGHAGSEEGGPVTGEGGRCARVGRR